MNLRKSKFLAAALSAVLTCTALPFSEVRADEGMFMMDKVATLPLQQKGLRISPNDIYNRAGGGISEAVVRLSIGCTAEFVSPDGLILTNHHCGFDALVAASTVENNYGENGYRAIAREQELPAKNYSLNITLRQEDVTDQVLNGVNQSDAKSVAARIEELQTAEKSRLGAEETVQIQALNSGLYYYKFVYKPIRDVRIVYAPPKSIGFYGGDPDNFEWTRHTGDFTFMRAYVGKDGKSAEYSKDNVPYKPKRFLTINTDGVKENDFTMIIGYPGGTNRYRESASIAYNQNIQLPFIVESLRAQIEALETIGRTNPEKRVKLQSEIFSLNNTLKAYDGGVAAMRRHGIVQKRQADEARLQQFIRSDVARSAKYGNVLTNLNQAYADLAATAQKDLILSILLQIPALNLMFAVASGQASKEQLANAIPEILESDKAVNQDLFRFFLRKAAALPVGQRIGAIEKRFGNLSNEARARAEDEFVRSIFTSQTLTTPAGLNGLLNSAANRNSEPVFAFVADVAPEIAAGLQKRQIFNQTIAQNRLLFIQAMNEMKNGLPYPDANFTQRFTYGAVKGYHPREAVGYTPFTTLNGIFEKDTGREPFDAPAKLRDLWQRKDFGVYNVNGSVPVNFLTTNDIIGGNSGSPVLNQNGEQVGIAFDGNYEGLGNDFFFSNELGRTIVVDLRYVLFVTEKFGDAGWILREMNIKGSNAKANTASR